MYPSSYPYDTILTYDCVQEVRKGFTWGSVTIVPLRPEEEEDFDSPRAAFTPTWAPEDTLTVPFQNENLYAVLSSPGKQDKVRIPYRSRTLLSEPVRYRY